MRHLLALLAFTAALASGCKGSVASNSPNSTVTGRVLVDNQPAAGVLVIFHNDVPSEGPKPTVRTDAAGLYSLAAVLPGSYRVTLSWPALQTHGPATDASEITPRERLPVAYLAAESTPLKAVVPQAEPIDFQVSSQPR